MPVKYTPELKQRAVELVLHAHADPATTRGVVTRNAEELGVSKETLRVWVRKHKETGTGTPAESIDLEAENHRLRAELAEAKRANDTLKRASVFRGGARLPAVVIVRFIDGNRAQFGVEPVSPGIAFNVRDNITEQVLRPQIQAAVGPIHSGQADHLGAASYLRRELFLIRCSQAAGGDQS